VDTLDLTNEPHRRFVVQGHILSTGGDTLQSDTGLCLFGHAIRMEKYKLKNWKMKLFLEVSTFNT
jgi:hypothetical protein